MIYGVGYNSGGVHKTRTPRPNPRNTKAYSVWQGILSRCYNPKSNRYHLYGARGCKVADEWLDFQVFAEWFHLNYIEGYHVDKDVNGDSLLYSPETCCFLSPFDNCQASQAKHYTFISPNGKRVNVFNLNKFCRDNNLQQGNINKVLNGTRKHHRGWKLWKGTNI